MPLTRLRDADADQTHTTGAPSGQPGKEISNGRAKRAKDETGRRGREADAFRDLCAHRIRGSGFCACADKPGRRGREADAFRDLCAHRIRGSGSGACAGGNSVSGRTFVVACLAGHGIGPEVTAAASRALAQVSRHHGFRIEEVHPPFDG